MKKTVCSGLIFIVLVSCTPNTSITLPETEEAISPPVATAIPDPPETSTSVETETTTLRIPASSPTPTISFPTPSSLDKEAAGDLQRVPSDIEGCSPPCWNGLTPGRSLASQVPVFFAYLGFESADLPNIEMIPAKELTGTYSFFRQFQGDTGLDVIEVMWAEYVEFIQLSYYRHPNLLGEEEFLHPVSLIANLGNPDSSQIYLEQNTRYLVYLDFSDKNTAILFEGYLTGNINDPLEICLSDTEDVGVKLRFYSDTSKPFSPHWLGSNADQLVEQTQYTGLDSSSFISLLIDKQECIPVSLGN